MNAPDLYKLVFCASTRVVNSLEHFSYISLPHFIPDIPHDILAELYDFLERYSSKTDFDALNSRVSLRFATDLACLYEHILAILTEAFYIPNYFTNGYYRTLQFQAPTVFNQQRTPPFPNTRWFKRIIFRNEYINTLTPHPPPLPPPNPAPVVPAPLMITLRRSTPRRTHPCK